MTYRMLLTSTVLLLSSILVSCGGGGEDSGSKATAQSPSKMDVSAELTQQTRVITPSDPAIVSQSTSEIVFQNDPNLAIEQVVITDQTALKIKAITPNSNGSYTVRGLTPELSDVFKKLHIEAQNIRLQASDFVPDEGVLTIANGSSSRGLQRAQPQSTVTSKLPISIQKKAFGGTFEIMASLEPTISFKMDHIALESIHAVADMNAEFVVAPSYSITGDGIGGEEVFQIGSYRVNVPIASVPIPYFVAIKVPVYLIISVNGGSSKFSVGAQAQTSYGFHAELHGDSAKPSTIYSTGKPWTFTPNGADIVAVDAEVGAEAKAYVRSGVSLTAFFGAVEPVAALASVGLKMEAKLLTTSTTNFQFNLECIKGAVKGFTEGVLRVRGLPETKLTLGADVVVYDYTPVSICGTNTYGRSFELGDTSNENYVIANGVVSGSRVRYIPGSKERVSMNISGKISPAPDGDSNVGLYSGTGSYVYTDQQGGTSSGSFAANGWLGPNGRFSWAAPVTSPYRFGNIGGLACTYQNCE